MMKMYKATARIVVILFLAITLSMASITPMKAQYSVDADTAALWHFDEVDANGVTSDATGNNPGTLKPAYASDAPLLVDGKYGKALSLDGDNDYVYVSDSPSLDIAGEITIEAWVYLKAFKTEEASIPTANNYIIYKHCVPPGEIYAYGLVVKTGLPETAGTMPQGAISGWIGIGVGIHEIVTNESVTSLNKWTHIAFTRSLTTGMHIYVNGEEKDVHAIYGVQNPSGSINNGAELYLGRHYHPLYPHLRYQLNGTIDEVRISNVAREKFPAAEVPSFWMQWWFWASVIAVIVVVAGAIYFLKKRKPPTPTR